MSDIELAEETWLQPRDTSLAMRRRPRVDWLDGDGPHAVLIDGRVLVGSSSSAGLVVRDGAVSRVHAELELRDDGLWVRDVGSRNGTFVDGLRVSGCLVPQHARIRVGGTELIVDYDAVEPCAVELWPSERFGDLVGVSACMRELFAALARIGPSDAPVLIHGETGTGKELVARALHQSSSRAKKPMVVVDCAALPDTLLDSELFGHARGAFTGALADRAGAFEAAEGGTVFLDEIGELPLAMQPKLLRVLEERSVRRVGESTHRRVDVRFLSATHRDLLQMVNAGTFREDLYFRLCVLPVDVPPLRDRKEDIPALVDRFMELAGGGVRVDSDVMRALGHLPWRGNVRELRNFVDRARALGAEDALALMSGVTLPRSRTILPSLADEPDEPTSVGSRGPQSPRIPPPAGVPNGVELPEMFGTSYRTFREAWVEAGEKEYVRRLLERHGRNIPAAAKEAEVDRTHIYRLLRKHNL